MCRAFTVRGGGQWVFTQPALWHLSEALQPLASARELTPEGTYPTFRNFFCEESHLPSWKVSPSALHLLTLTLVVVGPVG